MPKRSRSHQLEQISIQSFEQLLPEQWVCRRKDQDYGVDLEVEVFDPEGHSTGYMFYAQLKATEDLKAERSVSMKTDRLEYLASLDLPSMIVRYCHPSRTIHWQWLTNVFARLGEPSTKSVTVGFDVEDRWKAGDAAAILRTLQTYRTIRTAPRRLPIGLALRPEGLTGSQAFELNHAISQLRDASALITTASNPLACLPIEVTLDEAQRMVVTVDVISSITVELEKVARSEIVGHLAYVLAFMAARYDFDVQARELTRIIHEKRLVTRSRHLAAAVALVAIPDHPVAASIANLNRLYEEHDHAYVMYLQGLLGSDLPMADKATAVRSFYEEALASPGPERTTGQAAVHYSLANSLRVAGDFVSAVHHYNLARKKDPAYLSRGYFLAELGAALFFRQRYRISARMYARAHEVSPSTRVAICAGDASLYSGQFDQARDYFSAAQKSVDEFEHAEASLKLLLVDWIAEFFQRNPRERFGPFGQVPSWGALLNECIDAERFDHAFAASLMICFLLEDDVDIWTKAISISVKLEQVHLLLATFSCAIWCTGYEAYSLFRDTLRDHQFPEDLLNQFDEIARHLYEQRTAYKDPGVTVRSNGEHHFDTSQPPGEPFS
jgi:tetratricopeptide (TPR) repeat protein